MSSGTQISAVIGAASSPISISVANVFGVDDTPQISYSSTSVLLSDKTVYPSFFRTIPSDTYQAQALADLLKHFGWTYVSIVASDNAYGRAGVDSLRTELKKREICIALEEIFNPSLSQQELRHIIELLKNEQKAKVIILWCERPNAVGFLNEASRQKLGGKTWIGTETWGDAYQLKTLDENVVGGMLGVLPLLKRHEDYEEHLSRLQPNNTDYNPWMWEYWTDKFDCFTHDADHSNAIPVSNLQGLEEMYYVYTTKRPNVTLLCPKTSSAKPPSADLLPRNKYTNVMDAVYAVAHAVKNIVDCKDVKNLLKSEKCPAIVDSLIKPIDIVQFLKNVSFHGRSGSQIMFDNNGDLRFGSYAIKNLQQINDQEMDFKQIGIWNGQDGKLLVYNDSVITWNGWTSERPKSVCADPCTPGYYQVKGSVACCWKCVKSRLTAGGSYLISNKMQAIVALVMTLVPVTLTTIWFVVHPPEVVIKVDNAREGWQIVSCGTSNELLNIVILGYVLVIALLCTYFAFKARKLPENFNEAKFICFAMFAFCVFWLSFFPAFYDSVGSTRNFLFCLAVLGSGYAVLGIMYAPKLRVILFNPESNTAEAFRATTFVAMKKAGVVVSSNSATPPRITPVPSPVPSRRNSPDGGVVLEGRTSAVSIG
ncbi:unnamed protein product, partial [Porites lobata]